VNAWVRILNLFGCSTARPRQAAASIWAELTRFMGLLGSALRVVDVARIRVWCVPVGAGVVAARSSLRRVIGRQVMAGRHDGVLRVRSVGVNQNA